MAAEGRRVSPGFMHDSDGLARGDTGLRGARNQRAIRRESRITMTPAVAAAPPRQAQVMSLIMKLYDG